MNPYLSSLQPYPFEKLAKLNNQRSNSSKQEINLAIGEPKHTPAAFINEEVITHLHNLSRYPSTKGTPQLRESICKWATRRYHLPVDSLDPDQSVIPVNGTREALFSFAQCVVDHREKPLVVIPNPFYQIYEGAALLSGAEPWFINTTEDTKWLPDFDSVPDSVWARCQLLYICSPGNPTGAVLDSNSLTNLLELAEKFDFIIASDECYSEIFYNENTPPPGLLEAAASAGNIEYKRCIAFQSLSKRSNVPGMRSGFVAGDKDIIGKYLRYRTYHGSAMPLHHQAASSMAWQDEQHVIENRTNYRKKFDKVMQILGNTIQVEQPDASFYLWPKTPIDDATFARELFLRENVTVLPGSYLSREAHGINPGQGRVRIALVSQQDECVEAAHRIVQLTQSL
ncbi:MAG: succinyldiaminopimelate transaminase [Gammaproteobacteria bacterium]